MVKLLSFHNLNAFSLKAEKFIKAPRQRRLLDRLPAPTTLGWWLPLSSLHI